ncbi:RidA family protein [uncultured Roseobacter sp.]|uniref:RidA family protein n=1 Tax=uncultured Roseobacter sp. TaxID=114847 RepID=UPI00261DF0EF|nr:RidA family protein [uncultured Roseobacter sp.]
MIPSNIQRIHGPAKGRSTVSIFSGLVFAVAYDPDMTADIVDQTRNTLAFLDKHLVDAGSDKSAILQATVYLCDMSMKPKMDTVWEEWIGPPENWPQRACVGSDLGEGSLIEVVVTAVQIT